MTRIEPVSPDRMTAVQKAVADDIVKSRGSVRGPFPIMLHNPGLASASQRLGGYARFDSKIEPRLLEFAVAIVGRFWGAHVEWVSHSRLAREAGIDAVVLKAVEDGGRPDFAHDDEAAIHDFLTALLNKTKIDDATYAKCLETLGERGLIDLMAMITHYTIVSMTLNTFRVAVPEDHTPPFGPGRAGGAAPVSGESRGGARLGPLKREDMNDEQARAYDEVAARGGRLGGPNGIFIRVPELFALNQAVGNYLRAAHLGPRLRQLAMIVAVRRWNGAYAWGAQARDALKAGISREVVDAVNERRTPALDDADDRAIYAAAVELADTGSLTDAAFEAARAQLGHNRLLDLVATVGFYTGVCLTVNVFEVEPRPEFEVRLAP